MESAAIQKGLAEAEEFQDPRWIALRPSRLGLTVLAVGVLLALAALIWVALRSFLSPLWLILAAIFLAVVAVREAQKILLKSRSAPRAFYLVDLGTPGGSLSIEDTLGIRLLRAGSTEVMDGVVPAGSFVTPVFTAIAYRLPGDARWRPTRMLPLWKDSLDAEPFRQTRVRLRWH